MTTEKDVKKRLQKNAINAFEHFLHFLGEILQIVFLLAANATFNGDFNLYAMSSLVYQGGVLSIIVIYVSPLVRKEFKDFFVNNLIQLLVLLGCFSYALIKVSMS